VLPRRHRDRPYARTALALGADAAVRHRILVSNEANQPALRSSASFAAAAEDTVVTRLYSGKRCATSPTR
jgi:NAD(P)H-dependent flavin oxidoreductase YrpB (nitropropane dioxygenase family)